MTNLGGSSYDTPWVLEPEKEKKYVVSISKEG
jgi:hypothetical protein